MEQNDKSAPEIALSAVSCILPHALQLSVILHLTKTGTRILGQDTTCHHLLNCRFGGKCWFHQPQLSSASMAHNPYELAPSCSQRRRQTQDRAVTPPASNKATETTVTGTSPLLLPVKNPAPLSPVPSLTRLDASQTSESSSDTELDIQESNDCDHTLLKCKACYRFFSLSTETKTCCNDRNLRTPLRCDACRSRREAEDQPQRKKRPCTNQFDVLRTFCICSEPEETQPLEDNPHPETSLLADAIQTDDDDHGWQVKRRRRARKEPSPSPTTSEHRTCKACNCTFSLLNKTKQLFSELDLQLPMRCEPCRNLWKANHLQKTIKPKPTVIEHTHFLRIQSHQQKHPHNEQPTPPQIAHRKENCIASNA